MVFPLPSHLRKRTAGGHELRYQGLCRPFFFLFFSLVLFFGCKDGIQCGKRGRLVQKRDMKGLWGPRTLAKEGGAGTGTPGSITKI